jgi:hypothetical protein
MSDDTTASKEVTASRNYYKRIAQELQEFESDPIARGQQALDWAWEQKLAAQARRRRSVVPETGEYDPIRRLDAELDDQQELADRRYTRGY